LRYAVSAAWSAEISSPKVWSQVLGGGWVCLQSCWRFFLFGGYIVLRIIETIHSP
jgi:hypothetical protein